MSNEAKQQCPNTNVVGEGFRNAGEKMRCIHEAGHTGSCFFAAESVGVTRVGDPGCTPGFELTGKPAAPPCTGGQMKIEQPIYCKHGLPLTVLCDKCLHHIHVAPQQPIQTEFCPNSCIFPLGHDGYCKMGDDEPSLKEVIAAVRAKHPEALAGQCVSWERWHIYSYPMSGESLSDPHCGEMKTEEAAWRDALTRLEAVEER